MNKKQKQQNRWFSCLVLFFYLAVSFYNQLHLSTHYHPDLEATAEAHAEHDGDSDDDDHSPHSSSDHELLAWSRLESSHEGIHFLNPLLIEASPLVFEGLSCFRLVDTEIKADLANPSPPELVSSWHFVSRAALPVRAPSSLS